MLHSYAGRESAHRWHSHILRIRAAIGRGVLIVCGMLIFSSPVRAQGEPVFPAPQLESVWDFLSGRPVRDKIKFRRTDKLLRPPFSGSPEDSPKGLAAKIRSEELDVPKRVEAVMYLGTIDCVAYPEAQEMLIDVLHNDKWEPVRLAAAQALEIMLSNCGYQCANGQGANGGYSQYGGSYCGNSQCGSGYCGSSGCGSVYCGNPQCSRCQAQREGDRKGSKQEAKEAEKAEKEAAKRAERARNTPRPRIEQPERYDTCPGCCNEDVLNALAKTAYERLDNGCCFEPSQRVREAAVRAINACGICCRDWWWGYMEDAEIDQEPPEEPDVPQGEQTPEQRGEEKPDGEGEETPNSQDSIDVRFTPQPALLPQFGPSAQATSPHSQSAARLQELDALNGYCIVGLQAKQFYKSEPQFWSVYENRLYTFSSEAAKREFERIPEAYAVKYSGFDPVIANRQGQYVEGKYLRVYAKRFFLFAAKENWEEFKSNPDAYYAQDAVNLASGSR